MIDEPRWPAVIVGSLAFGGAMWWAGNRAGRAHVPAVEVQTREVVRTDTAEVDRLKRELAETRARKANVVTVETIREVPGGERVVTRVVRDTSTEDVVAKAAEVREVTKVERVEVDRLVHIEPKPLPRWLVAAGPSWSEAQWAPTGVAAALSLRITERWWVTAQAQRAGGETSGAILFGRAFE